MSTRLKEKYEKLEQILSVLSEESATGTPILVEGKKDVQALRELGFAGPMLTLKTGGKSLTRVVQEIEQVSARRLILLLDFDRRGKEATGILKENLEHAGVVADTRFWHVLKSVLSREIQCIESLTSYLDSLRKRANVTV